jgi:DNA polymerase elongation subunit (family B)
MGIVLKRRDNAQIVKKIYGGVIDIILNKRNVELSKKFFYDSIKDLLNGKSDINDLVISKTLRIDYANPNQIAHKVLADRLGERDPGNKPQSNDRIPYCYIDSSNLKCNICNGKVNPEKCKCITCMNIYCSTHLMAHKSVCNKICRFCKLNEHQCSLNKCNICTGWYCTKCNDHHKLRKDKYGVTHHDKCKKPLTNKLLQGDTIDHPQYIVEHDLKIDYKYYLEHQIEKPVFQIFELVMKKPETIIEDLKRSMNNAKSGNQSITSWFKAIDKNNNVYQAEDIISNKTNPKIIAKYVKEGENYSIPEFNL